MQKFVHNFIHCGILGWCIEILFTSIHSIQKREFDLKGNTSIWMFPIYGSAAFLAPLCRLLKNKPVWFRGFTYMSLIFGVEYITGMLLRKKSICPWDYGRSKWNVDRVIRLDFAPYWFGAGLIFERLLRETDDIVGKD